MKKSTFIGKILVISLAVAGLWACSSDDDDSFEVASSTFYVIQDGDGGTSEFTPFYGAVTTNSLASVRVANTTTGANIEGDIFALQNFETRVADENANVLGNTNGNYSVTLTATNGDVITQNYNFNRDIPQLLGPLVIESFEFTVVSQGQGADLKEWDEFMAVLTSPVSGATEYGLIIIPEGQGAYYRTEAYRYPIQLTNYADPQGGIKQRLYVREKANSIINRGSGSVSSWLVGVYATDGNGLYKEGTLRTLRRGVNSFD